MTLSINIPPEVERRLKEEAARQGIDEAEYARRVVERSLQPAGPRISLRWICWRNGRAKIRHPTRRRSNGEMRNLKN